MTLSLLFGVRAVGAPDREASATESRAARGDLSALGALYEAHHERVRAFARRLLGDDSAAEDLTHDVFVALPEALARFRGDASLTTLLFSIAVHQARTHLRTAIRRRRALARYEAPAPPTDPESAAGQQQLAAMLSAALDALPDEQRVVFVLCELEERTSVEVSQIVQCSDATVRTRLFHARRKVRERFSRLDAPGGVPR